MPEHKYRITVEELGQGEPGKAPICFEVSEHDDVYVIVDKIKSGNNLEADKACAFGVGLKLFAGVVRSMRRESPFAEIAPHLMDIMKIIKKPA